MTDNRDREFYEKFCEKSIRGEPWMYWKSDRSCEEVLNWFKAKLEEKDKEIATLNSIIVGLKTPDPMVLEPETVKALADIENQLTAQKKKAVEIAKKGNSDDAEWITEQLEMEL